MANELIQVRVPAEIKRQAEDVLAEIGMKTGEAIRIFLQQVINSNGLPFQPRKKTPNAETLQAFHESESGITYPLTLEEFSARYIDTSE